MIRAWPCDRPGQPAHQYYMRHPIDLLGRSTQRAARRDNVYILQRHLPCAAHEAPLQVE